MDVEVQRWQFVEKKTRSVAAGVRGMRECQQLKRRNGGALVKELVSGRASRGLAKIGLVEGCCGCGRCYRKES